MLSHKTVVLGITGSIAAYKAAELASKLTQAEIKVEVVMTESAMKFITPLTLRSLTGRTVTTSLWELSSEFSIEHVSLAEAADVVVIAPATANIIAKLACGLADDLLSTVVLATTAPLLIAPAMNVKMWENPLTRHNISKLREHGFAFVDPVSGELACGYEGEGRLIDIDKLTEAISRQLSASSSASPSFTEMSDGIIFYP